MPKLFAILSLFALGLTHSAVSFGQQAKSSSEAAAENRPLRALLIAGGCCHDYERQQELIAKGIQARANVRVDVYWTNDTSTTPIFPLYEKADWAASYDVIIHDECAADVKDPAIVNRILETHQKIPAVHLHCTMHSFRTGTDEWFKHLGVQSSSHGPQKPIDIHFVDTKHPITATLTDWTTINEELYNNVKVFDAHPIAIGKQRVGDAGKERVDEAIVAWTNETQGARSFSTTLGHNSETVSDPRYLELVTRGLLWACGKLDEAHLVPYEGESQVTALDAETVAAAQPSKWSDVPEGATLVKVTASSTQSGNDAANAVDGDLGTRWCADGDSYPQSIQLEFESPHAFTSIKLDWEFPNQAYRYRVEGSSDGKAWTMLLDKEANTTPDRDALPLAENSSKYVRVFATAGSGGWCSIREIKLEAPTLKTLWPADPKQSGAKFVPVQVDPFVREGNTVPYIDKLTPEQEAEILRDVQVPDEFEATVFAAPPAVNYPVFVAAATDGTLYVSSDGNGSLGRSANRGRVIRLRDLDGDGRADETKVFCKIDAPRGLVWDHDRLYLMHPPHLSAFIDRDGDGVAEEQQVLVRNLAFGYDKRPADHTTNGLSLGADGWLYIAGGDFGFIDAEGTDGRKVTHRGGGVIRVRPDGTGLEVYSTGTRNILEVAISPQMDLFARDNTNDGGGWDVRLHHFTGGDDHGYPRLYKNFNDECVQPLADYGGGSGCGAVYIDEPGMGDWNQAPFTADWGTGAIYRHTVSPQGATFAETAKPEPFIRMTRPTDADVDGNSRVYGASWRGATFDWQGTDVGYIVCVRPKNFTADPLPDFAKASDEQLVEVMNSPSYRRRIEAQRELMRRGNPAYKNLFAKSKNNRTSQRNLVDRLLAEATVAQCVDALGDSDPLVVHVAIRTLASRNAADACFGALERDAVTRSGALRSLAMMHSADVVQGLIDRLAAAESVEFRRGILAALCRLHFREGEWKGDSWGTRPDTRGPYYQPEAWSETAKIAEVLRTALDTATAGEAGFLVETMTRNRITTDATTERLITLASSDDQLLPLAVTQLAAMQNLPVEGLPLLLKAAEHASVSPQSRADAIGALANQSSPEVLSAMIRGLGLLEQANAPQDVQRRAADRFVASRSLDAHVSTLGTLAANGNADGFWAEAGLLAIASRTDASPESRTLAESALSKAWEEPARRVRLMQVAARIESHHLDNQILDAVNDADKSIAEAATKVAAQLKLERRAVDNTPKIATLSIDDAIKQSVATSGDVGFGKQIFTKANCVACHTVREDEVQKGPYLGTIAKTYKRPDLAVAILDPSKTIAQGFVTNAILLGDGRLVTGFVTNEQSDQVTLRDQQGSEMKILKDDIESRKTLPTSIMPSGLMNDFSTYELASLLDYLESLSK